MSTPKSWFDRPPGGEAARGDERALGQAHHPAETGDHDERQEHDRQRHPRRQDPERLEVAGLGPAPREPLERERHEQERRTPPTAGSGASAAARRGGPPSGCSSETDRASAPLLRPTTNRRTTVRMNGIADREPGELVEEVRAGWCRRSRTTRFCSTPSSRPPTNAIGIERSPASATAASEPRTMSVNCWSASWNSGAIRMPPMPASIIVSIHAADDVRDALTPRRPARSLAVRRPHASRARGGCGAARARARSRRAPRRRTPRPGRS